MQFSLLEGEESGERPESSFFSLQDNLELDTEDTCSELREADYQEALWRFLGSDVAPH